MSTVAAKNILITGVAGFIGANTLIYLVEKYPKYKFIGIDKLSYCSSIKNFQDVKGAANFKFIKADITNLDFMDFIFQSYAIDTVIHFAAYSHVDQSFGNSIIFTQNNVLGTHVLLEVAKRNQVERFIHVSTDEVYGSQEESQSDENSLLDPTNPYAATKAAAEHIARSYYHSFKFPIIITRGNNVYGPRQYPEKVIPKFIYRLKKDLQCNIHGSGGQQRSFLHVDDVAKAFDIILHRGVIGETYNIGCSDEHSIFEVATQLVKKIKPAAAVLDWINYAQDRDFNDQRYYISTQKLNDLGWHQEIDFNTGLNTTIDWYLNNLDYWSEDELKSTLNKH